ncbi:hypothetical protein [Richelia intracellularis]|uniref:hypothetical protein n=1 Tax=Richelia intracellularis TaxID=1164990 RepID=UPI002F2B6268
MASSYVVGEPSSVMIAIYPSGNVMSRKSGSGRVCNLQGSRLTLCFNSLNLLGNCVG